MLFPVLYRCFYQLNKLAVVSGETEVGSRGNVFLSMGPNENFTEYQYSRLWFWNHILADINLKHANIS